MPVCRQVAAFLLLACGTLFMSPQSAAAQPAAQQSVCSKSPPFSSNLASGPRWNGWGVDLEQHRFQPAEMASLAAQDVPRLKLRWVFGIPNASRAFAQPAVIGGRVIVGGQSRKVYSLDVKSGCTQWQFEASSPVRTAIFVDPDKNPPVAYFGDIQANVYAVDATNGTLLWKTHVDQHPAPMITGAPILVNTTLFVPVGSLEELSATDPEYPCCSFRGSLVALEAGTGRVLWKSFTINDEPKPHGNSESKQGLGPSGAAIWSSPTYDAKRHTVYITTGDNYSAPPTKTSDSILAFDAETGRLVWSRQVVAGDAYNMACGSSPGPNCPKEAGPDADFGSSAILVELPGGKRALVAGQKSGVVTAVNPDQGGEILWQRRIGEGGVLGGIEWGPAADDRNIYVAISDVRL